MINTGVRKWDQSWAAVKGEKLTSCFSVIIRCKAVSVPWKYQLEEGSPAHPSLLIIAKEGDYGRRGCKDKPFGLGGNIPHVF